MMGCKAGRYECFFCFLLLRWKVEWSIMGTIMTIIMSFWIHTHTHYCGSVSTCSAISRQFFLCAKMILKWLISARLLYKCLHFLRTEQTHKQGERKGHNGWVVFSEGTTHSLLLKKQFVFPDFLSPVWVKLQIRWISLYPLLVLKYPSTAYSPQTWRTLDWLSLLPQFMFTALPTPFPVPPAFCRTKQDSAHPIMFI